MRKAETEQEKRGTNKDNINRATSRKSTIFSNVLDVLWCCSLLVICVLFLFGSFYFQPRFFVGGGGVGCVGMGYCFFYLFISFFPSPAPFFCLLFLSSFAFSAASINLALYFDLLASSFLFAFIEGFLVLFPVFVHCFCILSLGYFL